MSGFINMTSSIKKNIEQLRIIPANPKYQKEMNEVISLYKSRKIENIRTAMKIADKFSVQGKGSTAAAKSGMKLLAPYRTREPATGKLSRGKKRTYFVKGTITVKSQYITTTRSKERIANQKIYEDKQNLGLTIEATSKEQAEAQFKQQARDSFDDRGVLGEESDNFKRSTVDNVNVNFVEEVVAGRSEAQTPMRRASPVQYSFIPEDAKHQKNDGFCVIDNFIGIYGPLIKHMTKDYFISLVQKHTEDHKYDISKGVTPLCLLEICKEYKISMYAYDVTSNCFLKNVGRMCNYPALVYFAVGGHMYYVSDKKSAQSLVKRAYDKEVKIKSVVLKEDWQLEKENKFEEKTYYSNFTTDIKINDDVPVTPFQHFRNVYAQNPGAFKNVHQLWQLPEHLKQSKQTQQLEPTKVYNNPINELHKYKKGVVVLDKKDLSDDLVEYIKTYNTVPSDLKNNNVTITGFYDKINDVVITTDPNDTRCVNYEIVKQICEDQEIDFTNQPLTAVVKQMRNKFMTTTRIRFDKEFINKIYIKQKKCCQMCKEALKLSNFEIDHIKALANGGTNDIKNLQILCKGCHYTKTKEEAEEGWVNQSQTESSYNSETSKIQESDLSRVWAFVEKHHENHNESLKIFGFDINKCRKNQMYYNKFNYPQFTVMDKVEEYTGNHSRAGKYYIEFEKESTSKWDQLTEFERKDVSDMRNETNPISLAHRSSSVYEYLKYKIPIKYFPLRGNGWYSQPMIKYCLSQKIIKDSDIKYVIYAGCEIKHNHFNELIDHYYKSLGKYNNDNLKFDKFAVNTMIGQFKPKSKTHWRSICVTPDINNAFYNYLSKAGCFIDNLTIDESNYHLVYEEFTTSYEETEAPIYEMVLELEAIELHKLSEIIKSKGGVVLDLITDCVTCQFSHNVSPFTSKDNINIDGYEFAPGVPKYKIEDKEDRLHVERMKAYIRTETFTYEKKQFQNIQDCDDNNFEPFVEMIVGGNKSINIDGRGGTGKSTLIGQLQNAMDEKDLKYVTLAPSNKAARLIKGDTIHKFIKKHPARIMKELNLDYYY